jgi:phosphate uptake regulator
MGLFSFLRNEPSPLLNQSVQEVRAMLTTAHDMFLAATANLLENEVLEVDLRALDATVNQREGAVRRAVLEHMALNPATDTVLSLVLVSIVDDAERIGDLAKSIAESARLASGPRMGENVEAARRIRDGVAAMFDGTRVAFVEGSADEARAVMEANAGVKRQVAAFLERLASQPGLDPNEAVVLSISSRMMSRTGSHLSNIASSVALPFDQIRRGAPRERAQGIAKAA